MNLLRFLARLTYRRRWFVLGGFAALLAAAAAYGAGASRFLAGGGFTDPESESARAARVLEEELGIRDPDVVLVYSHERASFRDPEFAGPLSAVLSRVAEQEGVRRVQSPYAPGGEALVARDGRAVLVTIELAGNEAERMRTFDRIEPLLTADGLQLRIGGSLPLEREAQRDAERDLRRGEMITIPIVAVLLILFFRGVVAAALPLSIGMFAIGAALACVRLLAHVTDVSTFAMNIVTFIGLGVAVDYSLFVTSRFREELAAGLSVPAALEHTMQKAGRTVAYSGLVVAVSLLGMLAFPVVLLRSVAISGALVVAMAVVATLTFLPAALAALGHRIEWLRIGGPRLEAHGRRLWRRVASLSMRAPVVVTVVTSATLLLLGLPFLRLEQVVGGPGILPTHADAREVADMLESGRFPAAARSTLTAVLRTDEPVLTREGLRAVERYADRVAALPGVERVDAIVGGHSPLSSAEVLAAGGRLPPPLAALARDHHTVVRVTGRAPPSSDEAQRLVRDVRAVTVPGAVALVGGQPAQRADLRRTIESGLPWTILVICSVTFVVLFLAFGSVVMPVKAILMTVLSLTASFGALVWIFQDGRLERLLGYESTGAIELTVPVVMFAVMFGLAMDYELFLLSRIREEYDRRRDTHESVVFGVEHTAAIITRAALLLVAVMLGFVAGSMLIIKQLGVGMVIAIVVDVTIVRGLLVPAAMQLLGHYNWWAPGPLARWWRRAGIGVDESPPPAGHTPEQPA